jgi:fatty-acyl-CoA synthase
LPFQYKGPGKETPENMDLSDWIKCHADTTPDKPAILFEGGEMSYASLAQRIDLFARVLIAGLGIQPGQRVAYLGQNSPEQIALLFACARVGAILLPLNWRLAAPEHVQLLKLSRPRAFFVDHGFVEHVNGLRDQIEAMELVSFSGAGDGWHDFEELAAQAGDISSMQVPTGLSDKDGLLLCYTSGTTGTPKGALLSKNAMAWNAENSVDMHDMTADDVVLTVLPMFHVGGLNIQTVPALITGATVVILRQFDVDLFYQAFEHSPVTLTLVVPTVMHLLMADERWSKDKDKLASLRMISIGSTTVPESLVNAVCDWGVPLVQVYGSTETCPIAAYTPPGDARRKPASTGKTAKYCHIRIADMSGQELPVGESGEILVSGPNVMTEYWHDPESTKEVLSGRWLHTGDIGHFDEEGFLYVDGRLKDMIISGGENIYPALIENVLSELDGIEEVAVVGRPDDHWGEVAVAVVVVKDGSDVNAERILDFCSGRISRFSCPREAIRVDHLPRNAMGKVLKKEIRQLVQKKAINRGQSKN